MNRLSVASSAGLIVVVCTTLACAPTLQQTGVQNRPKSAPPMLQLWTDPGDLSQRDLLWGPGRAANAPSKNVRYTVVKRDDSGYSPGYDVVGPDERKWSIKVGPEAQSEVVLSRILWALGYHQPETYYVIGWQLAGDWKYEGEPARFRLQSDHDSDGEWKWVDNPFAGTAPMHGLIAINLLLANWDLKTSNNRIYKIGEREPSRRYVVQDLGASLGKPRVFPIPVGTRNNIDDFETTTLIKDMEGAVVQLNYRGRHGEILERLSVADVIWACALMNRLRDAQLDAAFRAGGYAPDIRQRYIKKIRAKIQEGLALRPLAAARAGE
ncbi:MAG TPA: hypothetical protein VGF24_14625 [Vicinamibacterales bacterium]|jgi:hypothetical protein